LSEKLELTRKTFTIMDYINISECFFNGLPFYMIEAFSGAIQTGQQEKKT